MDPESCSCLSSQARNPPFWCRVCLVFSAYFWVWFWLSFFVFFLFGEWAHIFVRTWMRLTPDPLAFLSIPSEYSKGNVFHWYPIFLNMYDL